MVHRAQYLQLGISDAGAGTSRRRVDRNAVPGGLLSNEGGERSRWSQWTDPYLTNPTVLHDAHQTVDIIGMKVRDDQQRYPGDVKPVQTASHRGGRRAG